MSVKLPVGLYWIPPSLLNIEPRDMFTGDSQNHQSLHGE